MRPPNCLLSQHVWVIRQENLSRIPITSKVSFRKVTLNSFMTEKLRPKKCLNILSTEVKRKETFQSIFYQKKYLKIHCFYILECNIILLWIIKKTFYIRQKLIFVQNLGDTCYHEGAWIKQHKIQLGERRNYIVKTCGRTGIVAWSIEFLCSMYKNPVSTPSTK